MIAMKRGWMLVSVLLALLGGCAECAVAQAPLPVTTVQDTVYTAGGAAASGTVVVSWPGFTTASGAAIPAGTTSATIGTGGLLSMALAPNAGATPIGSYYTATFHLSDGSTSRQFWVVPVTTTEGSTVRLAAIQNDVLPTSVAMQTVSKAYVDMAIAAAVTGHPADSSTPYVLKTGDTMTGPLVLPADPMSANQAADKNYVDESVAALVSGTVRPPVFGPSGSGHAPGIVPDPGATAGATRYLREDGTWDAPPSGTGGGSGTMASQNANAVAITGGTAAFNTSSASVVPFSATNTSSTAGGSVPLGALYAPNSTSAEFLIVGRSAALDQAAVWGFLPTTQCAFATVFGRAGAFFVCNDGSVKTANNTLDDGSGGATFTKISGTKVFAPFAFTGYSLTSSVPTTTVATASCANATCQLQVSLTLSCVSSGATAIAPTIYWTDSSNTTQSVQPGQAQCTTLGANSVDNVILPIQAKNGSAIQINAFSSGSGPYDISMTVQQLTP